MTTDSPLRDRLRSALLEARRARDTEAASTLRTALAALENAEAVPVGETSGAIEDAPLGAGATEARRRVLSDARDPVGGSDAPAGSLVSREPGPARFFPGAPGAETSF